MVESKIQNNSSSKKDSLSSSSRSRLSTNKDKSQLSTPKQVNSSKYSEESEFDSSDDNDYISQMNRNREIDSDSDSEVDINDLDSDDSFIETKTTKRKPRSSAKSSESAKATKKTAPKKQTATKKAKPVSKESADDEESDDDEEFSDTDNVFTRGAVSQPPKWVFDKNGIYKYQVIKRILVRWNYIMKWKPVVQAAPSKEYMPLPSYPGVYVGVHGGVTGTILDLRDHTDSPCVNTLLEKPSSELKDMWLRAMEEQRKQLIEHEGPNAITLPNLDFEIQQARTFNAEYSDKQYKLIQLDPDQSFT